MEVKKLLWLFIGLTVIMGLTVCFYLGVYVEYSSRIYPTLSSINWNTLFSLLTALGTLGGVYMMLCSVQAIQRQIKLQEYSVLNTKIMHFIKELKQTPHKIDLFNYQNNLSETELYGKKLYVHDEFSQTCMEYFKKITNYASNLLYDIPQDHPSREFIEKTADYSNKFCDIMYKMIYFNEDFLGKITLNLYPLCIDILPRVNDVYAKDVINLWCRMAYNLVFSDRILSPKEYGLSEHDTVNNCLNLSKQKVDEVQIISDFWINADMEDKLHEADILLFDRLSAEERAKIDFASKIPAIVSRLASQNREEITVEELANFLTSP